MSGGGLFYLAFDAALALLAIRSGAVLGRRAPFTSAGWIGTLAYAVAAGAGAAEFVPHRTASSLSYVCLLVLTVAFVVAGIRDEPQAEPWWWPRRLGKTRAERRAYSEN